MLALARTIGCIVIARISLLQLKNILENILEIHMALLHQPRSEPEGSGVSEEHNALRESEANP